MNVAVLIIISGVCFYVDGRCISSDKILPTNETNCWDFFLLVQRWPYSTCQIVNASGSPCVIPENINSWTLHGLWPSNVNSYPQFCTSEIFNVTLVEDLKEELLLKWPNLYLNEAEDSLWKHEYEKHGTCAESLESFGKERDYFVNTMEYFDEYNVAKVLESAGIFPRKEPYNTKEFVELIQNGFDVVICPSCGHIKDFGQIISQIGICIDKTNRVVNCPTCSRQCKEDIPVYYQPNHPSNENLMYPVLINDGRIF